MSHAAARHVPVPVTATEVQQLCAETVTAAGVGFASPGTMRRGASPVSRPDGVPDGLAPVSDTGFDAPRDGAGRWTR